MFDDASMMRLVRFNAEARHVFGHLLTDYEKFEIAEYPEVWYAGSDAKVKGVHGAAQNSGFDDEHGSYIKVTI